MALTIIEIAQAVHLLLQIYAMTPSRTGAALGPLALAGLLLLLGGSASNIR